MGLEKGQKTRNPFKSKTDTGAGESKEKPSDRLTRANSNNNLWNWMVILLAVHFPSVIA
jgi:hypothetical protein